MGRRAPRGRSGASRPSPTGPASSPRHFARAFRAETGTTPGRYVDRVRVEHARRLLEDTGDGVEEISRSSGYGTPEVMRRAFVKALGTLTGRVPPPPVPRPSTEDATPLAERARNGNTCRSPSFSSTASPPLDAVGPYEMLSRIPKAETRLHRRADRPGPQRFGSLALTADRTLADVPRTRMSSSCRAAPARTRRWSTRPCWTGCAPSTPPAPGPPPVSPRLPAARRRGLLTGRRATSHWLALNLLEQYGVEPTGERVVTDGKYVTGGRRLRRHRHGPPHWSAASPATSTPRRSSC